MKATKRPQANLEANPEVRLLEEVELLNDAALPRLHALETYVRDPDTALSFWRQHFGLAPETDASYRMGDVIWQLRPGAEPCGTRGPHGALPAFQVHDFGQARGYLQAHKIQIVFEEMLPGLNLLIFLDPDSTPIELTQTTDPVAWDIAHRRELRLKRRQDQAPAGFLHLGRLDELTIYTHDITASVRFYRDLLGLPVGLSFFGHVHLLAENVPVVLRGTSWRCKAPHQRHTTEPVFAVPALATLAERLQRNGYRAVRKQEERLQVVDPAGLRVHCIQRSDPAPSSLAGAAS